MGLIDPCSTPLALGMGGGSRFPGCGAPWAALSNSFAVFAAVFRGISARSAFRHICFVAMCRRKTGNAEGVAQTNVAFHANLPISHPGFVPRLRRWGWEVGLGSQGAGHPGLCCRTASRFLLGFLGILPGMPVLRHMCFVAMRLQTKNFADFAFSATLR